MPYTFGTGKCWECGEITIFKNRRDINRKHFCCVSCARRYKGKRMDMHILWIKGNTPEANAKKVRKGSKNGRWISDRTKLKSQRGHTEEKWFFKEVLTERKFTCELTGYTGSGLSVHHLDGVRDHKDLQFDKNNVIVIKKEIHKLFHKLYGTINITREKFECFKKEQGYV